MFIGVCVCVCVLMRHRMAATRQLLFCCCSLSSHQLYTHRVFSGVWVGHVCVCSGKCTMHFTAAQVGGHLDWMGHLFVCRCMCANALRQVVCLCVREAWVCDPFCAPRCVLWTDKYFRGKVCNPLFLSKSLSAQITWNPKVFSHENQIQTAAETLWQHV